MRVGATRLVVRRSSRPTERRGAPLPPPGRQFGVALVGLRDPMIRRLSELRVAGRARVRHAGSTMKKSFATFLTALTLSLVAACGGGAGAASSAAGVYELDKAALKQTMLAAMPEEAKKEKMAMEMVDKMTDGMNVSIELKADGSATMSFKMDMMGQKKDDTETGTWKLDGTKLSMTTKEKDGKEETKTADYANGSFTIEHEDGGQKMKMTFKKK